GGLVCANAAVAAKASTVARTPARRPENTRLIRSLPFDSRIALQPLCRLKAIMPQAMGSRKPQAGHANAGFSAKRNALSGEDIRSRPPATTIAQQRGALRQYRAVRSSSLLPQRA